MNGFDAVGWMAVIVHTRFDDVYTTPQHIKSRPLSVSCMVTTPISLYLGRYLSVKMDITLKS